jgi:hypothetical protein
MGTVVAAARRDRLGWPRGHPSPTQGDTQAQLF